MKKKFLGILVCMLLVATAFASASKISYSRTDKQISTIDSGSVGQMLLNDDPEIEWNVTIGGVNRDFCMSMKETNDKGYIITGFTESFGKGKMDVWLVKTDKDGNEQWSHTFGSENDEWGAWVDQTSDGGYIIAGGIGDHEADKADMWVIRTDGYGNIIWNKTYGGDSNDWANSVESTNDGGYIIVGGTNSFGVGDFDIWLVKLDSDGDKEWDKTYGNIYYNFGQAVLQTDDGGFILISEGDTGFDNIVDYSIWLIKTDLQGNEEWSNILGGEYSDAGYGLQHTTDGGFIITGCTSTFQEILLDALLIKTDSQGKMAWNKIYYRSQLDTGDYVQQTIDGGYIITGIADLGIWSENSDIWTFKTDENGNKIWEVILGGIKNDEGKFVGQTSDGGFVIGGNTDSYGSGDTDIWLVKIKTVENQRPDKPMKPEGSTDGKTGTVYTYTCSATDPDDDQLYYLWTWGDSTYNDWQGPYESGEICEMKNIWYRDGNYEIKVKVKDIHGGESDWSDPLSVSMPKTKPYVITSFLQFLQSLMKGVPLLARILQLPVFEKLLGH